jgi:hypothetical protein
MATETLPKQPDFTVVTEENGQTLLTDGSIINTRIILADLIITKEDPFMGPEISISPLIALRVIAPQKLREQYKDKPILNAPDIPLTSESGFEQINIERAIKPTQSTYLFEGYLLVITLDINFVARNKLYKAPSGTPIYSVRWGINVKNTKATASK